MYLDGVDLEIGKIVISDSNAIFNKVSIPIKRIDIYSKDCNYKLTFLDTTRI